VRNLLVYISLVFPIWKELSIYHVFLHIFLLVRQGELESETAFCLKNYPSITGVQCAVLDQEKRNVRNGLFVVPYKYHIVELLMRFSMHFTFNCEANENCRRIVIF